MLEDDYSGSLNRRLEACQCDIAIPAEWQDRLTQRGVIQPVYDDRRKYVRYHFNGRAVLEYDETFSSIPRAHTFAQVVTRDFSRNGLAFLHSEQIFPGERVTLWLPTAKRTYVVVRCTEHNDRCFEIGVVVDGNEP